MTLIEATRAAFGRHGGVLMNLLDALPAQTFPSAPCPHPPINAQGNNLSSQQWTRGLGTRDEQKSQECQKKEEKKNGRQTDHRQEPINTTETGLTDLIVYISVARELCPPNSLH